MCRGGRKCWLNSEKNNWWYRVKPVNCCIIDIILIGETFQTVIQAKEMWAEFFYYHSVYNYKCSRSKYLNSRRGEVEKWNLNVVCCAGCLFFGCLSLLPTFLLPTLRFAGWLVYTTCVDSLTLAFTCVQPMNNVLKSMEKKRVRLGCVAPTPCLLMAVTGCVPSSNLTSIGWLSPWSRVSNRLSLGTAHCPFQ